MAKPLKLRNSPARLDWGTTILTVSLTEGVTYDNFRHIGHVYDDKKYNDRMNRLPEHYGKYKYVR